jgi:pilus assembly protein CpaF
MANPVDSLSKDVRDWAIENVSSLEHAINNVLDIRVEREDLNTVQEAVIRSELQKRMAGFGFLQKYLDDESIEEVWINKPGEVWFARAGRHFSESAPFVNEELITLVERMIRSSGRRLDRSTPFVDAQLESGYRLHAVIPDITRHHLSLNIRKFSTKVLTLDDLVADGVLQKAQAEFLRAELALGANLMISGATQAGKTTLLSALLSSLSETERVVSVEDTFELRCLLPDWVALQTRPESLEGKHGIDLRRLVRETLRMRPTRLVVGEVRGAEALDMLIAMNSGIPGLCTVHANSSEEALKKLLTLPLLAGGNITTGFLENLVESSMKLFVHCKRSNGGQRRIQSIMRMKLGSSLELEEVLL